MRRCVSLVVGIVLGLGVVGSFGLAPVAEAYVLPADYLIKLLAEKRRAQRIEDMSILMHTEQEDRDAPFDEHLYFEQPLRARRVEEDGTGRVYVEREGAVAAGEGGKLARHKGPPTDLTATLLVPGTSDLDAVAAQVVAVLGRLGIDTSMTSYGRDESEFVYIIGARAWEPQRPQLWLAKDSYLPVRAVAQITVDGKKVIEETRWLEWGSELTHEWFPRVIEVYRDGELYARSEVTEIKLNQDLPETLFDLP